MSNEFVMVPREPTPEMLAAAKKSGVIDPRVSGYCYELMVAAAPKHQGEPVAPVINAEQVLGAYQFASFGPANYLRGTTNWCAAFAQELNHRIGADTAEVERIGKELREVRDERDDLRRRVDDFQSRSHGIKNLSVIEQLNDKLAERDALLREKSGDLIRMAAHLISAPLFALQDLQDEDKKMTRARVDHAVDVADARLKDAAYELRRIADALSASPEPQVKS